MKLNCKGTKRIKQLKRCISTAVPKIEPKKQNLYTIPNNSTNFPDSLITFISFDPIEPTIRASPPIKKPSKPITDPMSNVNKSINLSLEFGIGFKRTRYKIKIVEIKDRHTHTNASFDL